MEENKSQNPTPSAWSLMGIWNSQLTFGRGEKKLEKRERIWASELGKDPYERWLKMNAIKPDFDFDERTLRKFEAGNFFERVIGLVLVSSGLLIHDNKSYEIPADDNHLLVSVRPDFVAGGKPNWEKVKQNIDEELLFKLMPNLGRIARSLVDEFSKKYPNGVKNMVYEIKSINSQVFWAQKDYLHEAYPHHRLQAFAEMKATGLKEGRILYISKDDLTVAEFSLFLNDPKLNELYEKDVREMTKYIREGVEPPKPENVIFDKKAKLRFQHNKKKEVIMGCYQGNWQVGWSNYITKITGIKGESQNQVSAKWKYFIKDEIKKKNDALKEIQIEKIDKKNI